MPEDAVAIERGEVHLWWAPIDPDESSVQRLSCLLSADELDRAAAFRSARDRCRFVAARASLRRILSQYVGVPPGRLEFWYPCLCGSVHCHVSLRKPALAPGMGATSIRFNLSHSGRRALFAIAWAREVGVDIERVEPGLDLESMTTYCLSPQEAVAFRRLPESCRAQAFYTAWTRKEAFLKATGDGLTHSPDRIEVSLGPGEPARLLMIDGDPEAAEHWSLHDLSPGEGYAGALAVDGPEPRLVVREWLPECH